MQLAAAGQSCSENAPVITMETACPRHEHNRESGRRRMDGMVSNGWHFGRHPRE
ncbi:hypothetical protein BAUCODRAFT_34533, partial [Baudoinia panamericana UAMH 10762]